MPRLDLERRLVLVAVLSHVVQHQLRLARPDEFPHHEGHGAAVCGIAGELRMDLAVQVTLWHECPNGLERSVREVTGEVGRTAAEESTRRELRDSHECR